MFLPDEAATLAAGARLAAVLLPGDVVELHGPLGAGKTTLVRGILQARGWAGAVRSPSFNLLSVYDLEPPVAHLDLYRIESPEGIGLEDLLDTHIIFIEWPKRLDELVDEESRWRVEIVPVEPEGRELRITPPLGRTIPALA